MAGPQLVKGLPGACAAWVVYDQMKALLHDLDKQICESFNGLHASMHPKRTDLSRTKAGYARHLLAAKRFNEGMWFPLVAIASQNWASAWALSATPF